MGTCTRVHDALEDWNGAALTRCGRLIPCYRLIKVGKPCEQCKLRKARAALAELPNASIVDAVALLG